MNITKSTEKLVNELKKSKNIDTFINDNEQELIDVKLSDYFNQLFEKYGMDKCQVFKNAQMAGNNYGYEIVNGKKKSVSRDKLIQICFGFPLTLEEVKLVLSLANVRPLYARVKRDACIMYALKNGYTIHQVEELLAERKLEPIRTDK